MEAAAVATTLRTAMIFLCFFSAIAKFKTFTQSYHTFNKSFPELQFVNDATIGYDALQVTRDISKASISSINLRDQSGRVMFRRKFRLWDGDVDSNSEVASFNTSFLVNIYVTNRTAGEGLAFLIAPTTDLPYASHGQFLGLTNENNDNVTTNGIVAVELDTLKQPFDIDSNHIGLNIHSIVSVVSKSLTPENITLAPEEGTPAFHNIWIQYNGVEKIIRVYIADQPEIDSPTPPMPNTPIIQYSLDLRRTVYRDSYLGFAASTGTQYQLNCVLRWNITVKYLPEPKSPLMKILLGIGIPMVLGLMALVACLGYYLYKRRLVKRSQSNILMQLRTLPGMPKEFRFRELKNATNNFDETRKLGQGGFGVVYRGVLSEDNVEVAVKWFSRESLKGEYDFLAELTIINRLRHKHLVRLLGNNSLP